MLFNQAAVLSSCGGPLGVLTTDNRAALRGKLENQFDASDALKDLYVQVEITSAFRQETFKAIDGWV